MRSIALALLLILGIGLCKSIEDEQQSHLKTSRTSWLRAAAATTKEEQVGGLADNENEDEEWLPFEFDEDEDEWLEDYDDFDEEDYDDEDFDDEEEDWLDEFDEEELLLEDAPVQDERSLTFWGNRRSSNFRMSGGGGGNCRCQYPGERYRPFINGVRILRRSNPSCRRVQFVCPGEPCNGPSWTCPRPPGGMMMPRPPPLPIPRPTPRPPLPIPSPVYSPVSSPVGYSPVAAPTSKGGKGSKSGSKGSKGGSKGSKGSSKGSKGGSKGSKRRLLDDHDGEPDFIREMRKLKGSKSGGSKGSKAGGKGGSSKGSKGGGSKGGKGSKGGTPIGPGKGEFVSRVFVQCFEN